MEEWDGVKERREPNQEKAMNILVLLTKIEAKLESHIDAFNKHADDEDKVIDMHNEKIDELEEKDNVLLKELTEIKGNIKALDGRINGSLDKINNYMDSGKAWRKTIVILALALLAQICTVVYMTVEFNKNYGQNERQININTKRLDILENRDYKAILEEIHHKNIADLTKEK